MSRGIKKQFVLEGLDCAHCATKIESSISLINGISFSSVNFSTKTLNIEVDRDQNMENILTEIDKQVHTIEPHIVIKDKSIHASQKSHHHNEKIIDKKEAIILGIGTFIFLLAVFIDYSPTINFSLYLLSYLLISREVLIKAFKNISRGQIFDENFLMSIASIGAFVIKEYPEGVAVMLFYQIGEMFQNAAVNRSRKSISALMDIRPDFANLKQGNKTEKVSPESICVGDIIIIKPGEKIPLDGIVISGESMLDTSALTGESLLRDAVKGTAVLSGSINTSGVLTVEVTKAFSESTVSKILDLVENASGNKAPTENFITKFARYYTPFVVFSATALAFIPPLLIPSASFYDWIQRALVFLVVSCPCALVISIPLGFFGGIGGASKNGILIKGSNYLEALNKVNTIVFDKTGTLTKGFFSVTQISSSKLSKEKLLEYAAYAESYSNHPIALSITKTYGQDIDKHVITNYNEISGKGIQATIRGKDILIGNHHWMDINNIKYPPIHNTGTIIHMALDGEYVGYIVVSDEIKDDSYATLQTLKNMGIQRIMLTGDHKTVSEKIGTDLDLDTVYSELLPDQKVKMIESIEKEKALKSKIVFVGDGINDAPVLARSDIGIAMGGLGSDAAIEAADIVLMTDEPSKIITALQIAKKTKKIVWQNIAFALGIKGLVLLLGAGGIATMWEAVFADVGVAIIAILNAMRAMNVKAIN